MSGEEKKQADQDQPAGKDYSKLSVSAPVAKHTVANSAVGASLTMKAVSQSLGALLSEASHKSHGEENEEITLDAQAVVDQVTDRYTIPSSKVFPATAPPNKYKNLDMNKASEVLATPTSPKKKTVATDRASLLPSLPAENGEKSPKGNNNKYALESLDFNKAKKVLAMNTEHECEKEKCNKNTGTDTTSSANNSDLGKAGGAKPTRSRSVTRSRSMTRSGPDARSASNSPAGDAANPRKSLEKRRSRANNSTSPLKDGTTPADNSDVGKVSGAKATRSRSVTRSRSMTGSRPDARSASTSPAGDAANPRKSLEKRRSRTNMSTRRSFSPVPNNNDGQGERRKPERARSFNAGQGERPRARRSRSFNEGRGQRRSFNDGTGGQRRSVTPLRSLNERSNPNSRQLAIGPSANANVRDPLRRSQNGTNERSEAGTTNGGDSTAPTKARVTSASLRRSLAQAAAPSEEEVLAKAMEEVEAKEDTTADPDPTPGATTTNPQHLPGVSTEQQTVPPESPVPTSTAEAKRASVMVPFAKEIPKECIKKKREADRKAGRKPNGKVDKSFSDMAFDPGFADLYDD